MHGPMKPSGASRCALNLCQTCGALLAFLLPFAAWAVDQDDGGGFYTPPSYLAGHDSTPYDPEAPAPTPEPLEGWWADLGDALEEAAEARQPVLALFMASWAPPCRALRDDVLSSDKARWALRGIVTVEIDVEARPDMAQAFAINQLPTFVVLGSDGVEYDRFTGYLPPNAFAETLEAAVDPRQAPAELERQIADEPGDLRAHWQLARKYARDRNHEALDRTLDQMRRADPGNIEGYLDNVAYLEMMTTLNAEHPSDGLRSARRFLREFPRSEFADQATLTTAHLAYQMGQTDECLRILEEFPERFPRSQLATDVARDLDTIRAELEGETETESRVRPKARSNVLTGSLP